jgi:hypothetical protein
MVCLGLQDLVENEDITDVRRSEKWKVNIGTPGCIHTGS